MNDTQYLQDIQKNLNLKKEVGIAIKSKETSTVVCSNQLEIAM